MKRKSAAPTEGLDTAYRLVERGFIATHTEFKNLVNQLLVKAEQ
jgi:hypothetical protein